MREKQLPHSREAEECTLGSLLIDGDAITKVSDFLRPQHFYCEAHRLIYEAMLALHQKHEPTDYELLFEELSRVGHLEQVGGMSYLIGLTNTVPTSGNIIYYARIVEKKAQFRAAIHACGDIAAEAYAEEGEAFQHAQERFFKIGQEGIAGNVIRDHIDSLSLYWKVLEDLHEQNTKGTLTGIPTGFKMLNKMLGGFRDSKSYILAARPGEGKTAMALNFAYQAIKTGFQVLFFSIEMDEGELMQRLLAIESKVNSTHLRDAKLDDEEWQHVVDGIASLQNTSGKLWTDDTPAHDISSIRAKARAAKAEHGIDMIIVDYLQLAKAGETNHKADNRRLEVERVSRELKEMARELHIPVLALAQLNRDVESRASRVPQLSDLREAGGIEQDGDVIMFIYRDPLIPQEAPEYDVTLIVAKHRNGEKGNVPMHYVGAQTRFYPINME